MASYIVLMGPPGAGKGTQAKSVAQELGLAHVSSGDLFRENLKNQTELGQLAQTYMTRGELVPDDVTIAMIRERLQRDDTRKGALLDGFPRTPAQAQSLDAMLAKAGEQIAVAPFITVPADELIDRLSGRWTCRSQGHIYHEKFNPPKVAGVCDIDQSELYQRDDDKAETVRNRIHVYEKQTAPLIEYYRQRGKLVEIDGTQPIEAVTQDLLAAIRKEA